MMTFTAHHIGQPLSRYYLDYRVLCEANLAVQQAFDLDIVQAISDPYREAHDLGLEVVFPADGLPISRAPLLVAPGDLNKLKPIRPEQGRRMSDRVEAIRTFRQQVGGEVPIMGWVEGALAEAADLRGVGTLMLDLVDRPEWVQDLLEICVQVEIDFARAQVEAGADIIGLGDSIASQISPGMYHRFALPYEQRIFAAIREMGAWGRLHICGNISHILELAASSGTDILDPDWMVDLDYAAHTVGDKVALCGNMDPVAVLLQGTPELVREQVIACARKGGRRWVCAAGCEVPDGTPHTNLRSQAQALRDIGSTM
jgi:uroporphyrinogen decarboxylase